MNTFEMVRNVVATGSDAVVISSILKAGLVEKKAAASNEAEIIGRIIKFVEGKNAQPVMDAVNALAVTGSKSVMDVVKFINARTPYQFTNLSDKLMVNEQGQILFNKDSEAAKASTTSVRQWLVAKCKEFDAAEEAEGRSSDLAITAKYETLYHFSLRKSVDSRAADWYNGKMGLKGDDRIKEADVADFVAGDVADYAELRVKHAEMEADDAERQAFWDAFMADEDLVVKVSQYNAETEQMEMRDCAPFKAGVSVSAFNAMLKRIERASKAGKTVKAKAKPVSSVSDDVKALREALAELIAKDKNAAKALLAEQLATVTELEDGYVIVHKTEAGVTLIPEIFLRDDEGRLVQIENSED